MAIFILSVLDRFPLRDWQLPAFWMENTQAALPDGEIIYPLMISGTIISTGALFGFPAGGSWLAERGGFDVNVS